MASEAHGAHGAVATDQGLATAVGIRVLRDGGNAVDAAVAIGYALAVTLPSAGNLGGGGFMTLRRADGSTAFLDFRERAPARATAHMFLDRRGEPVPNLSLDGALSVAVPGTVAGLERARERWGTRSRRALIAPAITLAERGFVLSRADADVFAAETSRLAADDDARRLFTAHGKPLAAGARLRQPELARSLRAIAAGGADAFYRGDLGRRLVRAIQRRGGIVSTTDLAAYRTVERAPLRCTYGGAEIVTAPPPSSGGVVLCEVLGIIGVGARAPHDAAAIHLEVEAERRAFADRNALLADPDAAGAPLARILSRAYLAAQRAAIDPRRATPSTAIRPGDPLHEGSHTTHYSVIDAAGNAVALTYTLNDDFGSATVAGDTGILLNDEMDDFTTAPGRANLYGLVQGEANAVAPGKRPLSSMSPTIVVRGGRVVLAVGAAGGPRIITTTLDVIRAVTDAGATIDRAVQAKRLHHQWLPDELAVERGALAPPVRAALQRMGYRLRDGSAESSANAVGVTPSGVRIAAHDDRRPTGTARAY